MTDNGIVILQTATEDGDPEYRVAYLSNVDNIYGEWDDDLQNWQPDRDEILDNFTECDIYAELEDAFDYAQELAKKTDFLDNGIVVNKDFRNFVFYNI